MPPLSFILMPLLTVPFNYVLAASTPKCTLVEPMLAETRDYIDWLPPGVFVRLPLTCADGLPFATARSNVLDVSRGLETLE